MAYAMKTKSPLPFKTSAADEHDEGEDSDTSLPSSTRSGKLDRLNQGLRSNDKQKIIPQQAEVLRQIKRGCIGMTREAAGRESKALIGRLDHVKFVTIPASAQSRTLANLAKQLLNELIKVLVSLGSHVSDVVKWRINLPLAIEELKNEMMTTKSTINRNKQEILELQMLGVEFPPQETDRDTDNNRTIREWKDAKARRMFGEFERAAQLKARMENESKQEEENTEDSPDLIVEGVFPGQESNDDNDSEMNEAERRIVALDKFRRTNAAYLKWVKREEPSKRALLAHENLIAYEEDLVNFHKRKARFQLLKTTELTANDELDATVAAIIMLERYIEVNMMIFSMVYESIKENSSLIAVLNTRVNLEETTITMSNSVSNADLSGIYYGLLKAYSEPSIVSMTESLKTLMAYPYQNRQAVDRADIDPMCIYRWFHDELNSWRDTGMFKYITEDVLFTVCLLNAYPPQSQVSQQLSQHLFQQISLRDFYNGSHAATSSTTPMLDCCSNYLQQVYTQTQRLTEMGRRNVVGNTAQHSTRVPPPRATGVVALNAEKYESSTGMTWNMITTTTAEYDKEVTREEKMCYQHPKTSVIHCYTATRTPCNNGNCTHFKDMRCFTRFPCSRCQLYGHPVAACKQVIKTTDPMVKKKP
jgi:hypothetical protein